MKKILYYILNLTFHTLDKDIIKLIGNKNKLTIFDVGCYRGVFFKKIYYKLKSNNKRLIFHLFDINPNVKKYINKFLFLKSFFYNEISLSNKNGFANYHYNSFFESSGSSLSKVYKNDKLWVFSRKFILTLLLQSTKNYIKYKVPTCTLDEYSRKNKIGVIDVLKIDVDGSEVDVLHGCKKMLKNKNINIILVEINSNKKTFENKEKKITSFLNRYNLSLAKKFNILSVSFLSNIRSADYLFVRKNLFIKDDNKLIFPLNLINI